MEEAAQVLFHGDGERNLFERFKDVNLIDVLDMIADCTMAGMARSGSVYPLELSSDVLQAAFKNTCALLLSQVRVIQEPEARQ